MTDGKTAAERAQELLNERPLGKNAIAVILSGEGFTQAEIDEVTAETDWIKQGVRFIQERNKEGEGLGLPVLRITEMWALGFDSDTAQAALENVDFEKDIEKLFEVGAFAKANSQSIKEYLFAAGYPEAQIEAVLTRADVHDEDLCREAAQELLGHGISRRMLQEVLMSRGFPKKMVRQVIRELKPDWSRQAAMVAERARTHQPYYPDVKNHLLMMGFASGEADAGMDGMEFGGTEAAALLAADYMELSAKSAEDLTRIMLYYGFPEESFRETVEDLEKNTDWTKTAAQVVSAQIRNNSVTGGPRSIRKEMQGLGYTRKQIDRTFALLKDMDWVSRAEEEFSDANAEREPCIDSPVSVRDKIMDLGYNRETAEEAVGRLFPYPQDEKKTALYEVMALPYPMGYEGLRDELEAARYSPDAVQYVLDNVYYDWNDMAAVRAQQLADEIISAYEELTPNWLRDILADEGFTPAQADYGVQKVGVDWEAACNDMAAELPGSPDEIRQKLTGEGFAPELVEKAVTRLKTE